MNDTEPRDRREFPRAPRSNTHFPRFVAEQQAAARLSDLAQPISDYWRDLNERCAD